MKKLVSILLTLAVAVSLMAMPAVTSAASSPTIDGVIETDEWGSPDFVCTQNKPGPIDYNLYIENDADNLYIAAEYVSGDFSVNQGLGLANSLNIYIDSNNNGDVVDAPDNGDVGIILSDDDMLMIPYDPPANDWDWQATGSFKAAGGDYASDGDYTTGNGIVEVKIPFTLLGSAGPGSTIGLLFQAFGYDCCPVVPDVHPNWPSSYTDFTLEANTAVGLTAETSNITAINVDPTSIAFGTITPGTPNDGDNITVENIGGVTVDVDAYLDPLNGTVFNYLKLGGAYSPAYCGDWADYIISGLKPSLNQTLTTVLDVPSTYSGKGHEAATLIFEATAV